MPYVKPSRQTAKTTSPAKAVRKNHVIHIQLHLDDLTRTFHTPKTKSHHRETEHSATQQKKGFICFNKQSKNTSVKQVKKQTNISALLGKTPRPQSLSHKSIPLQTPTLKDVPAWLTLKPSVKVKGQSGSSCLGSHSQKHQQVEQKRAVHKQEYAQLLTRFKNWLHSLNKSTKK
jgi:hypothetical protein